MTTFDEELRGLRTLVAEAREALARTDDGLARMEARFGPALTALAALGVGGPRGEQWPPPAADAAREPRGAADRTDAATPAGGTAPCAAARARPVATRASAHRRGAASNRRDDPPRHRGAPVVVRGGDRAPAERAGEGASDPHVPAPRHDPEAQAVRRARADPDPRREAGGQVRRRRRADEAPAVAARRTAPPPCAAPLALSVIVTVDIASAHRHTIAHRSW